MPKSDGAKFDGISDFVKSAPRRLADARELLETPSLNPGGSDHAYRHLDGACYLAGYAVECMLKVYLMACTIVGKGRTSTTWTETKKARGWDSRLRGAKAHNLKVLRSLTDLEGAMDSDRAIKAAWGEVIKNWEPSLRYRGQPLRDPAEAREIVDACEQVYHWLERHTSVPRPSKRR
jgi:hypothetical protein